MGRLYERRGEEAMAAQIYGSSLEMSYPSTDQYQCGQCGASFGQWLARCDACGEWNTVQLCFQVEPVSSEDFLLHERPVWPVDGQD